MAGPMKPKTLPHQQAGRPVPTADDVGGRVLALEASVDSIAEDVTEIRGALGNVVTKDEMVGLRQDVRGLSMQLQAQGKTQWPLIFSGLGVLFTVIMAIGGLAYLPVQQGQSANTAAIADLAAQIVPREEYEARRASADRQIQQLADAIALIDQRQYDALLRELARAQGN